MSKQVVHYTGKPVFYNGGWGRYAITQPVDHPDSYHVSNTKPITTSLIIKEMDKDGVFETQNTIYKPL
jgi:hypothetical protein